jgi:C-terminal processing protease CtpA/Prc
MLNRNLVLVLAVGVGVVIGAVSVSRFETSDSPQPDTGALIERLEHSESSELNPQQVTEVLESLIQILDKEIGERRALEVQLDEVWSAVTEMQQQLDARIDDDASQERQDQVTETLEDRLLAAGFTLQQIETIRRRDAEVGMRWAELEDRARREGWIDTPRYFEEINKLTTGANSNRNNLSDDEYDRYLYASGRDNRIVVGEVFGTSAAELAGIQSGDVIRSYDSERVFSLEQLNNLRSAGEIGSLVIVEIVRNGQPVQVTIPRGPIGIQTQSELVDPAS